MTDQAGRNVSDYVEITVGQRPTVDLTVTTDANGFQFGDTVQYTVAVTDDDPVDCSKVSCPTCSVTTRTGIRCPRPSGAPAPSRQLAGGHDRATDNLNAVFSASYTDAGSGNLPPLTGTDQVVIEPVAP